MLQRQCASMGEGVNQCVVVGEGETRGEVADGRRSGYSDDAEPGGKARVLAWNPDIAERLTAAHRVVGDVQHVIGLVVWPMDLEHVQVLVDHPDEAGPLDQAMHRAHSAVGHRPRSIAEFVGGSPVRENRRSAVSPLPRSLKSASDLTLPFC